MRSRYRDEDAERALATWGARHGEDLALRVYTSRLLGADAALVLHGGGNTSVKSTARERTGEEVSVLYVKGSGWDLGAIEPAGFPACRLAPLVKGAGLATLEDPEMVALLRSQMLDPSSPTPSVEALLHALLPWKFIDHTHADAVLACVDQPDSARIVEEIWGARALFVPYVMPGFVLAKALADLLDAAKRAELIILDKHGIFTWGATAKESYERMIAEVTRAEAYVGSRRRVRMKAPAPMADDARARLLPALRGALARAAHADGRDGRFVLATTGADDVRRLASHPERATLAGTGPLTPDHVIRTRPWPLLLPPVDGEIPAEGRALDELLDAALAAFATRYGAYVAYAREARGAEVKPLDALPRAVLVPGLGGIGIGASVADARIVCDILEHTAEVILDAADVGTYRPVSPVDLFDVEYWSLEQAKLGKGGGALPLARRIALVTGAARGIGLATAEAMLAAGAHVFLVDRDEARLDDARASLVKRFGARVSGATCDVTERDAVARAVDACVLAFGGLDVVVSNAGTAPTGLLHTEAGEARLEESLRVNLLSHQYVARAASRVLLAQGTGGALLFNASKSAWNQGPDFGPYAVAKAGVLSLMRQYAVDLGPLGVRAGAVNADRIRTGLFGGGVLEARAAARGVSVDAYFEANLLRRETTARDVADAFVYLATAEATTGAVLTVDGGNAAAFPR